MRRADIIFNCKWNTPLNNTAKKYAAITFAQALKPIEGSAKPWSPIGEAERDGFRRQIAVYFNWQATASQIIELTRFRATHTMYVLMYDAFHASTITRCTSYIEILCNTLRVYLSEIALFIIVGFRLFAADHALKCKHNQIDVKH